MTNSVADLYTKLSYTNDKSAHDLVLNNDQRTTATYKMTNMQMLLCSQNGGGGC